MHRFLPATRRGRVLAASALIAFFALDILALLGSELATKLLANLAGAALGLAAMLLLTHPFRRGLRHSQAGRMIGILLAVGSVFGVILVGSTAAGIPFFPTASGGYAGFLIYGAALGAGVAVASRLDAGTTGPRPSLLGETPGPEWRIAAVVVGTICALLAVFFVLYVLLEYVATPLIRSLAA